MDLSNDYSFEPRLDYGEHVPVKMSIRGIRLDPEVIDGYLNAAGCCLPEGYVEAFCKCLTAPSNPLSIPETVRDEENDLSISDKKYYKILPVGFSQRISIKEELQIDFCNGRIPKVSLSSEKESGTIKFEVSFGGKELSADEVWEIANCLSKLHSSISLEGRPVEKSALESDKEIAFDDGIAVTFGKLDALEEQTMPKVEEATKEKTKSAYLVPYGIKLVEASEDLERSILSVFKSEDAYHLYECGAIKAMKDSLDDVSETPFKMLSNLTSQEQAISFTIDHNIILLSQEAYNEKRFSEYGEDGEIAVASPYEEQPEEYDDDGFEDDLEDDSESFVFEVNVIDDDLGELNLSVVKKGSIETEELEKTDDDDTVLEIMWDASAAIQEKIWRVVFDSVQLFGMDSKTFHSNILGISRPSVVTSEMTCGLFIEGSDCKAQIWLKPVLKEEEAKK